MGVDNKANLNQDTNNDLDISVDLSKATVESATAEGQTAGSHDSRKGYSFAAGLYLRNTENTDGDIQKAFYSGYKNGYDGNIPLDDISASSDRLVEPKAATTNPNPINHSRNALIAFAVIFAVLAAAAIAGGVFAAIAMTGGVAAVPAGLVLFSVSGFAVGLKAAMIAAFSAAAVTVATTVGLSVGAHQSIKAVLSDDTDAFTRAEGIDGGLEGGLLLPEGASASAAPAAGNQTMLNIFAAQLSGAHSDQAGSGPTLGPDSFRQLNTGYGASDGQPPEMIGLERADSVDLRP